MSLAAVVSNASEIACLSLFLQEHIKNRNSLLYFYHHGTTAFKKLLGSYTYQKPILQYNYTTNILLSTSVMSMVLWNFFLFFGEAAYMVYSDYNIL